MAQKDNYACFSMAKSTQVLIMLLLIAAAIIKVSGGEFAEDMLKVLEQAN